MPSSISASVMMYGGSMRMTVPVVRFTTTPRSRAAVATGKASVLSSIPAMRPAPRTWAITVGYLAASPFSRYSPANSQVWIRLEEHDGKACVVVADQGQGMSEEEQGRIFEKFERLGRSGDGGSGLGLYISRRLARAMGGELSEGGLAGLNTEVGPQGMAGLA